jgi:hypothetical protein
VPLSVTCTMKCAVTAASTSGKRKPTRARFSVPSDSGVLSVPASG